MVRDLCFYRAGMERPKQAWENEPPKEDFDY